MNKIMLFMCLGLMFSALDVDGFLLKHLPTKPGGILDSLAKARQGGFNLGSHLGGGISLGLGSFGFNLGFNKQFVPGGVNQPPKEPHIPEGGIGNPDGNPCGPGLKPGYPDGNPCGPGLKPGYPNGNPHIPGVNPGYPVGNPYIPGVNPGYPNENPYVPGNKPVIPQNPEIKPPKPSITWEDDEIEKEPYYPPSKEKDYSKPGSHESIGSPEREDKDRRPNWEDIGETYNKDSKSENYMDSDLVGDGLIQPRQKNKRIKRFVESKVYHVPILFQSNAKPTRVKIQSSLNSLEKV